MDFKPNSAPTTRVNFKRLRGYTKDAQKYKLFCPLCSQRMEPLIVDSTPEGQPQEETIWWTCQGVKTKSCDFPLSMPSEVFWTTRNAQQIESDVVPLPNFHLLPTKYHHLYSAFYKPTQPSPGQTTEVPLSRSTVKRNATSGSFPQRPSKIIKSNRPRTPKETSGVNRAAFSDEKCMELVGSHVRYLPRAESISARLGKEYQAPKKATTTIEWTGMDLNRAGSSDNNEQNSVNLPSCSSGSSNSLEQDFNLLPEGHPLRLPTLGDSELDNLVRGNLSAILCSKKLRKRKKKLKVKPVEQDSPILDNSYLPYAHPEHPDQRDEFDIGIDPCWY